MNKLLQFFNSSVLKIGVALSLLFIPLYPKLPSISVTHTWVYIRAEDFLIAIVTFIWIVLLLRKKVKLPFPLATPIILYWIVGLISLLFSVIFIGPHLANFFPKIAALEYLRRIEYMILFFIAISTVKSEKDILFYLKVIFATVTGVVLYGFGQRWYVLLWHQFPKFFEKYPFCFPSFQTGNEEFAKGLALCLPPDARITSTFGGHYDLAAYLVIIIPLLFAAVFIFKNIFAKIFILILSIASLMLLILTSSRTSFVAYLVGICFMLFFAKQKKYILPVLIFSIILLLSFSSSTAQRFLETIRFTSVVTNSQGQVVGVTTSSLPTDLQKKISKNPTVVAAPPPSQNLPTGSSFITLPGKQITTHVAVVQSNAPQSVVKNLKYAYGGQEISTISGTFLVKKALVYDISITTRFQAEWPNAWNAFLRNPFLGSGYSSISLATDGDYFRMLGETGAFGMVTFALIFMFFGTLVYAVGPDAPKTARYFAYGLAGGIIGLFINASLIDVFESSKVAESLWLLSGIGMGGMLLYQREKINYKFYMKKIFTSNILIGIYLFILTGIVFFQTISNFFVADDFTWLRWAGESNIQDLKGYLLNASGFFYRPLDKFIIFALFSVSAFQPQSYHIFILILHFITTVGVYLLLKKIFGDKLWAFLGSVMFLLLPIHGENIYWLSTISTTLSSLFIVYATLAWLMFREKSLTAYIFSLLLSILAFLSYEMAIVIPGILLISDFFLVKHKKTWRMFLAYIPILFIIGGYWFVRHISRAVSFGGDYAYSGVHFIPNFLGNFFGYLGIVIFGEYFFPTYTALRSNLRMYSLPFIIFFAVIVLLILGLVIGKKKFVHRWMRAKAFRMWLYGICFAIVGLLPFIGLGNITERYVYFASLGFIISFVSIVQSIAQIFLQREKKMIYIFVGIVLLIIIWFGYDVRRESQQWQQAGEITMSTLGILRNNYADIQPSAHLYFVNVPIRYQNAWVFPTGLTDALWFIYRDSSPKIYSVKDVSTAHSLMSSEHAVRQYIFIFNKQGNIGEVQQ